MLYHILEYEKYIFEQWGKNFFQKPHFFFEVCLGVFWEIPELLETKKNRSEIASSFPAVARLDLSYVSENEGFGNS